MNAPREVMRTIRRRGGQIVKATTRFDDERGGRVLELEAFWPGRTGYDEPVTPMECEVVESKIVGPDRWRDTTYRRPDGSTFRVAGPLRTTAMYEDGSYEQAYDEAAEANMRDRLATREELKEGD